MASISTTHIPFIEALESLNILKGFSGVHYISSPIVIKRISEKKIANLGFPLNIEKRGYSLILPCNNLSGLEHSLQAFEDAFALPSNIDYLAQYRYQSN